MHILAIHGGAGTIRPSLMDPGLEAEHRAGLAAALRAGHAVLSGGGGALDAVTAAVVVMEDHPLFNAGRGAVFTADGRQEMDACVMDGPTQRIGALAGICGPRNPVRAARTVMEHSSHILLAGSGAHAFLRAHGVPFEDTAYFHTDRRWAALQAMLDTQADPGLTPDDADRHGTVGAVARDRYGALAAATSTGGMTGKLPGRIGDTPLPGAGTWADAAVAMSATGHGESFIRANAGHELSALVRLGGASSSGTPLADAAEAVLALVAGFGGDGGLVAVDAAGCVTMPFNSRGMYRGVVGADGITHTGIYRDDLVPTAC